MMHGSRKMVHDAQTDRWTDRQKEKVAQGHVQLISGLALPTRMRKN